LLRNRQHEEIEGASDVTDNSKRRKGRYEQGCQFGFFEAKFVILSFYQHFVLEKRPNEIWIFWPFLAT